MIYFYTGQPGHGKTLHALERLIQFKEQGRVVYAVNVRDLQYEKLGIQPMTPEEFKTWPDTLPGGSVVLVDECYEHGMIPKRAPGQKIPHWVEQLAKHRHSGHDFILVCQSPTKQIDSFVHDLCERHVHVRRRFGTQFVHLREFDRFEPRPEKAHPLVLKRTTLPKRPMGSYTSTVLDTTEKKIPWYYFAAAFLVVFICLAVWWSARGVSNTLDPNKPRSAVTTPGDGGTTAPGVGAAFGATQSLGNAVEYAQLHAPRFETMPWTAPVYDGRSVTADPQLFCMSTTGGLDALGDTKEPSCSCRTEQGTIYDSLSIEQCLFVAKSGTPYNHYKQPAQSVAQQLPASPHAQAAHAPTAYTPTGSGAPYGAMHTGYGDLGVPTGRYVGQGVSMGR